MCGTIFIILNHMAGNGISKICISRTRFHNWQSIFQIECHRVIDTVVKRNEYKCNQPNGLKCTVADVRKYVTKTSVTPPMRWRHCQFILCGIHYIHSIRSFWVSLFGLHTHLLSVNYSLCKCRIFFVVLRIHSYDIYVDSLFPALSSFEN